MGPTSATRRLRYLFVPRRALGGPKRGRPPIWARYTLVAALWVAVVLYSAFIYYLSSAPLEDHGGSIIALHDILGESIGQAGTSGEERSLWTPILEHLVIYAGFGALGFMAVTSMRVLPARSERLRALFIELSLWATPIVILMALAYGTFDEWHQSWVPGRSPQATDVMVDVVGALIGAALAPSAAPAISTGGSGGKRGTTPQVSSLVTDNFK